jgi:glutathione S-transferase
MIRLHDSASSGNSYKVRLLLKQLGLTFERVPYDLAKGEARTPQFRARFPLGRLPVIELEGGEQLAESNAILCYFGEGSRYLPQDRLERARCLQWMFYEQYSHEPYIAVARAWISHFGVPPGKHAELRERQAKGYAALETMERHLAGNPWFSGRQYGIADIALFAYTHVAHEGEFDLGRFTAVREWIERVRNTPGFVPLEA